jgi:hypothetical protein
VLTFSASGWTFNDTFILYDFETESLWYHRFGDDGMTCIQGEFQDRKLPELTSYKTRWNQWFKNHPQTKLMACKTTSLGCAGY